MKEATNFEPKEIRRNDSQENDNSKWSQLVEQTWSDESLKHRLLKDPAPVLREYGIKVPANIEVRVVENTEAISHLILPAKPACGVTELTADQLSSVAGGASGGGGVTYLKYTFGTIFTS